MGGEVNLLSERQMKTIQIFLPYFEKNLDKTHDQKEVLQIVILHSLLLL
jgi:hypothetical protein